MNSKDVQDCAERNIDVNPVINGIVKYQVSTSVFPRRQLIWFLPASWDTPSLSIPLTLALVVVLLYVNRLLIQHL